MIVEGPKGISHVATHVRASLLPSISDPFLSANLRFTAMCLDLISEDYDRAADILVDDRHQLVRIFEAARPHVSEDVRKRLETRLADPIASLRVTKLTEQFDSDMRELIELHTFVEGEEAAGQAWAAVLNLEIWRFIENYAARRMYQSPI